MDDLGEKTPPFLGNIQKCIFAEGCFTKKSSKPWVFFGGGRLWSNGGKITTIPISTHPQPHLGGRKAIEPVFDLPMEILKPSKVEEGFIAVELGGYGQVEDTINGKIFFVAPLAQNMLFYCILYIQYI